MKPRSMFLVFWFCVVCDALFQGSAELVSVKKIWDAAPHNAFTDLGRFDGKWFCVFREGKTTIYLAKVKIEPK